MIPQSTIDKILDAANIVDVVSDYVTLKRAGANYKGLCPFHDDTTPSFSVSPSRNLCKCFACGKGGSPLHFIMEIEQLNFYEAIKFLGKKYGIEVEERQLTPEQRQAESERESMFAVNEWACEYFHNHLLNSPDGQAIGLAYFRGRGFRDDIIEKFRLGFCSDKDDKMSSVAISKGFNPDYLIKTGLAYKSDRTNQLCDKFRGRVMFPWFSLSGKVTGFGGRVLDSRTKGVIQKYINSAESDIYHKRNELYGLYQSKRAIGKEDRVLMVEGYTDVISMHQCGIENVVANSGTALSNEQIRLLLRFTRNITLIYDGDEAGIHAALRGTNMLLESGMNVNILLIPDGDDPDGFARKHNATELREFIEKNQTDFISFKSRVLLGEAGNDPQRRKALIDDIVESISVIPDAIGRSVYIHQCSEILDVKEEILIHEVSRRRKERKQSSTQTTSTDTPQSQPIQEITTTEIPINPSSAHLLGLERLIMRMVVRYGSVVFKVDPSDKSSSEITVLQYVCNDLAEDELTLQNPLYRTMLAEAQSLAANSGVAVDFARHFLASQDLEISKETAELLSDRYQLAKIYEGDSRSESARPGNFIIHLMLDYKYSVVMESIKEIKRQLADPTVLSDTTKCAEILRKQILYNNIKCRLAKILGDRVIC